MKYIEWGLFLLGAILLVSLIHETGFDRLSADVALIGWWFILVLLQELIPHSANTLGWWFSISPEKRRIIHPFKLFGYRLAGDGINYLTPTATIGGEFIRIRMTSSLLGTEESTASVTIAKFAQAAGQILFIVLGLAGTIPFLNVLGDNRWWMFSIVIFFPIGVIGFGWLLRGGLFSFISNTLSSWGFAQKWLSENKEKIQKIDSLILHCIQERPKDLFLSIFFYAFAFAISVIEVWLILYCLGLPTPWHVIFSIEILSVLIDVVLFFVPAKMGTQEGGKMAIFKILSMDPVKGLAMGVIRRGRELFWAFTGLVIYGFVKTRLRNEKESRKT